MPGAGPSLAVASVGTECLTSLNFPSAHLSNGRSNRHSWAAWLCRLNRVLRLRTRVLVTHMSSEWSPPFSVGFYVRFLCNLD